MTADGAQDPASDIPTVAGVAALRAQVAAWRSAGQTVGLVTTMGALHTGHLSLIDLAKSRTDKVVASIFVNPTQFAANEDLSTYPRTTAQDLAMLDDRGCDLAYLPDVATMYPDGFATSVRVADLSDVLCGQSRPHHFGGVATVVAKLLIQAGPDVAVFGEKDFQQLLVIRRMARDLDLPVDIVGAPVIREADGLAMSSRNAYLSQEERTVAPALNQVLVAVAEALNDGALAAAALTEGRNRLTAAGFTVDYLEVRDDSALQPLGYEERLPDAPGRSFRVFGAAHLGRTRLIDNVALTAC